MSAIIVGYPRCTTCKKAEKYLADKGVSYTYRDIKEDNPSLEELKAWHTASGLDIKRFFNTSGMKYRELALKDKLPTMTDQEKFELLATDGMLVKRPILIYEDKVTTGFKEKEWNDILS